MHNIPYNIKAGITVFKEKLQQVDNDIDLPDDIMKWNDIEKALYLYVGKQKEYVGKVQWGIARFLEYRAENMK